MLTYEVLNDCFCEGYLHEIANYGRNGLEEKRLSKGDKVQFINTWSNFYGKYTRVEKDGIQYDILPKNLIKTS